MITESQENYLASLPNGKTIIIKPFDPKAQEVAQGIVEKLKEILPESQIHFGGASALGISGQNDIDINILTTPAEYEKYIPLIQQVFGEPTKRGTSIKWEVVQEGFDVELYLTDKDSSGLQDQLKVFDILYNNQVLRKEYEQSKLPYGEIDFKDYMRKKYEFFNKILEVE